MINILSAMTTHAYHTPPSDLDLVTLSPRKEAIFNHLAKIGWKRFPEFIADILKEVEGHTDIQITDGSGDEKQDILSTTSQGRRRLTQCKHTANYTEKASGDELDVMFSACFRKNCQEGIYVTNSDLTVQAKRYINDEEFIRGWRGDPKEVPRIDYWHCERIWERISKSTAILNKYFSGMAQVHGQRSFFFDTVVTKMPSYESRFSCEILQKVVDC